MKIIWRHIFSFYWNSSQKKQIISELHQQIIRSLLVHSYEVKKEEELENIVYIYIFVYYCICIFMSMQMIGKYGIVNNEKIQIVREEIV